MKRRTFFGGVLAAVFMSWRRTDCGADWADRQPPSRAEDCPACRDLPLVETSVMHWHDGTTSEMRSVELLPALEENLRRKQQAKWLANDPAAVLIREAMSKFTFDDVSVVCMACGRRIL